jgi:hypothetical protein
VLNVGDLKPAEADIDYFLGLAWDEPKNAAESQHEFLLRWATEQFGSDVAGSIANVWEKAYELNFVRKPEFMGFNGYDDAVERTAFNPLAWGDEGKERMAVWKDLADRSAGIATHVQADALPAYFELVGYPVEAAAAQNAKFLWLDRQTVDLQRGDAAASAVDFKESVEAYDRVQQLTAIYNGLEHGKWNGMMSAHPRDRHVFDPPKMVTTIAALPDSWKPGVAVASTTGKGATEFREVNGTVSINATHFANAGGEGQERWRVLPELGISGGSVVFGLPGREHGASWLSDGKPDTMAPALEYRFVTTTDDNATLRVYLLPTFPVDSSVGLRYAVQIDDRPVVVLDASGAEQHRSGMTTWESNVLSNAAVQTVALGSLKPGMHSLRFIYGDPGIVVQHLTVTFPQAAPGYPVPPETALLR